MEQFIGNNFIWFMGIVENNIDPLKISRLQVRIFGIHSDNKQLIPTKALPWAQVSYGINYPGFGTAKIGDQVWGFFLDGQQKQYPLIIGIIPSIPEESANPQKGFSDPRNIEDLKNAPSKPEKIDFIDNGSGANITNGIANSYPIHLNEPEISRFARNYNISNTIIGTLNANLLKEIKSANSENKFSEPNFEYSGKYPYIKGIESESGHALIFDDGKNNENISLIHRTGSNFQYKSNGSKSEKIVKDNYQAIYGNDTIYVMGKVNIVVNGEAQVYVKQNAEIKVDKDMNLTVNGNVTETIKGNKTTTIEGNNISNVKGDIKTHSDKAIKINSGVEFSYDSVIINENNGKGYF